MIAASREMSDEPFFYYEKLCLTPKYLTTVIKKESGVSAADWIERYVILQAQALLKSTDLTIQQISDNTHSLHNTTRCIIALILVAFLFILPPYCPVFPQRNLSLP